MNKKDRRIQSDVTVSDNAKEVRFGKKYLYL